MDPEVKRQLVDIKRGVVELISEEELIKKLKDKRPLRIKAGFDPTAADLHLGHTVLLNKLKAFQDLGHHVIFLIGDFTAAIGDPSGRSNTRPELSETDIKKNIKTYEEQVFKILDRKRTQVVYNSSWMKAKTATDLIRLASKYSVARMLERDDFEKRYKSGESIAVHEFLYPLIQGFDSVQLQADVEIGGTDQKFNLLVGRHLQKDAGQEPQVVLTLPLLVGTDGIQKMSKTFKNAIGITESPQEILGKMMSINDELMWMYYDLLSFQTMEELAQLKAKVKKGDLHPMKAKKDLACEMVTRFYGEAAALEALQEFERIFSQKEKPANVPEVMLPADEHPILVAKILWELKLTKSIGEARRLISQNAVIINDEKFTDPQGGLPARGEYFFKVGKRRFYRVIFR
ncbi:MAG: tyrosine--tRNA ligase [Deltaproteobacteria bacterium RIFCSPLOWO2_02_FULL_50_16]|nr:MAG: tyrosine--tRNA ligase [Deltaproteobacteria bacterium GWA2_50_8]OGQ25820.1 MAG: tyrosine--tRNA ligase [Deltaproteobacteria bacterium RIFCSPHIGHO2_02_FULL_50_15]OGQ56227.1 MAG: tyrosine--tRNA ligase [Deltaproteobacteria bacterium RIFCSPLOWO2_02_FULL_50_16]OGQ66243.1 MAG: tyrosine--tRNA ligase [Deltaproteobacteria bacterium RIFCSPLOWO2_12_FULL_50_11]